MPVWHRLRWTSGRRLNSCSRLEEGIIVIEDNNSCMSLPQDFPVGQDMEEEDGDTNAQVYITLRLMCVYSTDKLLRLLLHFWKFIFILSLISGVCVRVYLCT